MSDEPGDADTPATPRRRRQAREQGHVARSRELVLALTFGSVVASLLYAGPTQWASLKRFVADRLQQAAAVRSPSELVSEVLPHLVSLVVNRCLPYLLLIAGVAVLAQLMQHGLLWLPGKIMPNFDRIHPVYVWQRQMSTGFGARFLIGSLKTLLLVLITIELLRGHEQELASWLQHPWELLVVRSGQLMARLLTWVGVGCLVCGGIDYAWQLHCYEKSLRMSTDDLREEVKAVRNDITLRKRPPASSAAPRE